jgi:hypothetical protein
MPTQNTVAVGKFQDLPPARHALSFLSLPIHEEFRASRYLKGEEKWRQTLYVMSLYSSNLTCNRRLWEGSLLLWFFSLLPGFNFQVWHF